MTGNPEGISYKAESLLKPKAKSYFGYTIEIDYG